LLQLNRVLSSPGPPPPFSLSLPLFSLSTFPTFLLSIPSPCPYLPSPHFQSLPSPLLPLYHPPSPYRIFIPHILTLYLPLLPFGLLPPSRFSPLPVFPLLPFLALPSSYLFYAGNLVSLLSLYLSTLSFSYIFSLSSPSPALPCSSFSPSLLLSLSIFLSYLLLYLSFPSPAIYFLSVFPR
jgi:hypothetical protein